GRSSDLNPGLESRVDRMGGVGERRIGHLGDFRWTWQDQFKNYCLNRHALSQDRVCSRHPDRGGGSWELTKTRSHSSPAVVQDLAKRLPSCWRVGVPGCWSPTSTSRQPNELRGRSPAMAVSRIRCGRTPPRERTTRRPWHALWTRGAHCTTPSTTLESVVPLRSL